jgi:hypothetical protein
VARQTADAFKDSAVLVGRGVLRMGYETKHVGERAGVEAGGAKQVARRLVGAELVGLALMCAGRGRAAETLPAVGRAVEVTQLVRDSRGERLVLVEEVNQPARDEDSTVGK